MIFFSVPLMKQICVTVGASLAYLAIGLVRGYSASAIPSIQLLDPNIITTEEVKSWVGGIPPLGAFMGSTAAGWAMRRVGRRRTLQLAAPLWAGAWMLLSVAEAPPLLLVARFLTGFCVGLVLPTTQVYISECSDPAVRGRLSSVPALFMAAGILLSYVLGYWFTWRYLAGISGACCLLLATCLAVLPESPAWLAASGRPDEARHAHAWLQLTSEPPSATATTHYGSEKNKVFTSNELFSRDVLLSRRILKPLAIGMLLLTFQQISGIDAVIFFTVEIFKTSSSSIENHVATITVGAVQLLATAVAALLADRAGRRLLLLVSGVTSAVAMAAMGAAFQLQHLQRQYYLIGYLPLISLIVFMVGYSIGLGCVPFVLLGELFPASHRSQLSALAGALNLLTMFVVIKTYHVLQALLTSAGTFWLYSAFCALSVMYVAICVPETKGKSLEEIENLFRSAPVQEKREAIGRENDIEVSSRL